MGWKGRMLTKRGKLQVGSKDQASFPENFTFTLYPETRRQMNRGHLLSGGALAALMGPDPFLAPVPSSGDLGPFRWLRDVLHTS